MELFYKTQYRIHQASLTERKEDVSSENTVDWTVNEPEIKVSENI